MKYKHSHPIRRRFMAVAIAVSALAGSSMPEDSSEALAKATDVHTIDESHEEHKHHWHLIKGIKNRFHH